MMKLVLVALVLIFLCGCLSAGTHGSIKTYDFCASNQDVRKAVYQIFQEDSTVYRRQVMKPTDSTVLDQYNDGVKYIYFYISQAKDAFQYIVRFAREKEPEDSAKHTTLFIAYCYNRNGEGGSEGNGGFDQLDKSTQNKLIGLFESRIVYKIQRKIAAGSRENL